MRTVGRTIDGTVEHARRVDPIDAQGRDEGQGLPATVRGLLGQASPAPAPAAQRGHVRLGPGLVDEDEPLGIDASLVALPALPPARDVRPVLLGRGEAFF